MTGYLIAFAVILGPVALLLLIASALRAWALHHPAKPRFCRCGHGFEAHEHYRQGSDCALCKCPRWRRRRYSASELADLSRDDIPEWPYVRVPRSGEVAWEAVMRAVDGDPPPGCDPCIVRDPKTPQQGDSS
jgi:hypothetical protein